MTTTSRAVCLNRIKHDYISDDLAASIQGDHRLCTDCTRFIDNAFEETVLPTYDQVCAALNQRAGV